MRAIMYHYVRPHDTAYPHFRYLDVADFRTQLDQLGTSHRWITRDELVESLRNHQPIPNGLLLTFDDGFNDHYTHVFPELHRRKIPGIFYIPTRPLADGQLLEVHRTHLLLGRHGGQRIFERLQQLVTEDMLSHKHVAEFFSIPYRSQTNDQWTVAVKRTLNYLIDYAVRPRIMETLAREFLPDEPDLARNFYLTPAQFLEMHQNGMIIGSHTVNHPCMSKLSLADQKREIHDSFATIERTLGPLPLKTFCYPYGGSHSFTRDTERLLQNAGCHFSFSVEYREITSEDLLHRNQALPRYDCNMIPKLINSPGTNS
jgi:peptidoglycan/xylan/chitin deacetylase (PgdA/CDA1 family)